MISHNAVLLDNFSFQTNSRVELLSYEGSLTYKLFNLTYRNIIVAYNSFYAPRIFFYYYIPPKNPLGAASCCGMFI